MEEGALGAVGGCLEAFAAAWADPGPARASPKYFMVANETNGSWRLKVPRLEMNANVARALIDFDKYIERSRINSEIFEIGDKYFRLAPLSQGNYPHLGWVTAGRTW